MKKIIFLCFLFLFSLFLQADEYNVAFYSDFEPVSYAVNRDPHNPDFNTPKGCEVDLLKAIEAIPNSNISFKFHGVKDWNNIWLQPYHNPNIDLAIGGITRENSRLLGADGKQVVDVTHKTLNFKQSLLMNTKNSKEIKNHEDLTCAYVVGAVRGTTGEYRYLAQSNLINDIDSGLLKKGIVVTLENKKFIISDGTLSIYDPSIENRSMLIPPTCSSAITKYFVAEDSMIPALNDGFIDAIARGYIGNKLVADRSKGELEVKAIYSLECPRQQSVTCTKKEEAVFFVKKENTELLEKLNRYIDYLTDNGKIDFDHWQANQSIFLQRGKNYKS